MSAYQAKSAKYVNAILRLTCGLMLGCLAACLGCQQESKTVQSRPITGWQAPQQSKIGAMRARPEPKLLPVTHFASAQLLESGGDLDGAAQQYRLAIALNHSYVAAYERLAQLLDRLGQYDAAERVWREGIACAPEVASLRNDFGFHYLLQRRYSQAALYFDSALMVDPAYQRARINLGITLAQVGQADEALEQFREALPEAQAQYNLGLVLRQNNRVREAAGAFRAALQADPFMAAARVHLGQLESILDEMATSRSRLAAAEADYSPDPNQNAPSNDSYGAPSASAGPMGSADTASTSAASIGPTAPDLLTMPESTAHAQVRQEPGLLPFLDEWAALYADYANCLPAEWELLTPAEQVNYSLAVEAPAYDTAEVPTPAETQDKPADQAISRASATEEVSEPGMPGWLGQPDMLISRFVELLSRHMSPGDLCVEEQGRTGPMVPASPSISQARTWVDFDAVQDVPPTGLDSARFAWAEPERDRIERPRRTSARVLSAIEAYRMLDGHAAPASAVIQDHHAEIVHPWNLSRHLPAEQVVETPRAAWDPGEETAHAGLGVRYAPEIGELIAPSPRSHLIPRPIR